MGIGDGVLALLLFLFVTVLLGIACKKSAKKCLAGWGILFFVLVILMWMAVLGWTIYGEWYLNLQKKILLN